jgi:hypothetical protein
MLHDKMLIPSAKGSISVYNWTEHTHPFVLFFPFFNGD